MAGKSLGKVFGTLRSALPGFSVAALCVVSLIISASPVRACGYHNQADLARGAMNLAFPKSLYVRTAVWQAQLNGVLPRRKRSAEKDLFSYQRTASQLMKMARHLRVSQGNELAFTVVLLDSMLWTRFVSGPETYVATVHADGPKNGDVVLVAETPVIRAFVEGRLDPESAERHGLFRLYGPMNKQAEVRNALSGLSAPTPPESMNGTR